MTRSSKAKYADYQNKRRASKDRGAALLDDQSGKRKDSARTRTFLVLLKEFVRQCAGSHGTLAFALFTVTISSILMLVAPASTKFVFDWVLARPARLEQLPAWVPGPRDPSMMLWTVCLGVLAVSLVSLVVGIAGRYQVTLLTKRVSARLRRRAFDHAVNLPLHRIQHYKSGGIASILREDAGQAGELVFTMIYNPFKSVVQLIGTLVILAWTDWRMLVGGLLVMPVVWFTNRAWVTRIRPVFKDIRITRTAIDAHTTEVFGGVRVVRSFDRSRSESTRFSVGQHFMIRKELLVWWWSRVLESAWSVMIPLASGVVTIYAGNAILKGTLSLGDLVMFSTYLLMLLMPLELLTATATNIQTNLAAFDRLLDLWQEPREFEATASDQVLERGQVRGAVELRGVSFAYPKVSAKAGGEHAMALVLQGINLTVPAGETIALVGASGAGKTTLCNLVARFYDPTEGAVLVDGIDLRNVEPGSYRRLLGIVEQDVFLFDGTIAENIAYGRRDATVAEIEGAARAAFAHDFISKTEKGYKTLIGERGVRLSGGQKQRIAIARAILSDPAILILDEATSNLDAESEAFIQLSLGDLMKGRTCFVIAHRLSTIRNADRIVVLEQGRIIETGRHDELLARGGRYADLLRTQVEAHARASGPDTGQNAGTVRIPNTVSPGI